MAFLAYLKANGVADVDPEAVIGEGAPSQLLDAWRRLGERTALVSDDWEMTLASARTRLRFSIHLLEEQRAPHV